REPEGGGMVGEDAVDFVAGQAVGRCKSPDAAGLQIEMVKAAACADVEAIRGFLLDAIDEIARQLSGERLDDELRAISRRVVNPAQSVLFARDPDSPRAVA